MIRFVGWSFRLLLQVSRRCIEQHTRPWCVRCVVASIKAPAMLCLPGVCFVCATPRDCHHDMDRYSRVLACTTG